MIDFLRAYQTHPEAYRVNSDLLAEFILTMVADQELTDWTVALIGGGTEAKTPITDEVAIRMLERKQESGNESKYSIGRLMSPRDEGIDLSEAEWNAALAVTRQMWRSSSAKNKSEEEPDVPSGVAIRMVRGLGAPGVSARPDTGVLALYLLDPIRADANFPAGAPPIVTFGISFPGSKSECKVEYKVNNILWEQEYGPAD